MEGGSNCYSHFSHHISRALYDEFEYLSNPSNFHCYKFFRTTSDIEFTEMLSMNLCSCNSFTPSIGIAKGRRILQPIRFSGLSVKIVWLTLFLRIHFYPASESPLRKLLCIYLPHELLLSHSYCCRSAPSCKHPKRCT